MCIGLINIQILDSMLVMHSNLALSSSSKRHKNLSSPSISFGAIAGVLLFPSVAARAEMYPRGPITSEHLALTNLIAAPMEAARDRLTAIEVRVSTAGRTLHRPERFEKDLARLSSLLNQGKLSEAEDYSRNLVMNQDARLRSKLFWRCSIAAIIGAAAACGFSFGKFRSRGVRALLWTTAIVGGGVAGALYGYGETFASFPIFSIICGIVLPLAIMERVPARRSRTNIPKRGSPHQDTTASTGEGVIIDV
jgi:hypothetical protein